jgi:hypothetical protein
MDAALVVTGFEGLRIMELRAAFHGIPRTLWRLNMALLLVMVFECSRFFLEGHAEVECLDRVVREGIAVIVARVLVS